MPFCIRCVAAIEIRCFLVGVPNCQVSLSLRSGWHGGKFNQTYGWWTWVRWEAGLRIIQGREDGDYLMRCHLESQHHTDLVPRNIELNGGDTLFNVTDGLCQWGICHREMNPICQVSGHTFPLTPWEFSLESLGPFPFKLKINSSSECSGAAAHSSGSHGKTQGEWPDCSRN